MFELVSIATANQEVKRSRFVATAAPIADTEAAKAFVAQHSVTDANHNCWAWRIGQTYRFSDDGEPSGTAGKPILQAIDGFELDMVAVVVTRWFGGTLLGAGGLIRAYGGTAAQCLQCAEKREILPTIAATIDVQFSHLALVKAKLHSEAGVQVLEERFTESGALLSVTIAASLAEQVFDTIRDLTSGRATVKLD
ncbi:putative YigZ family protein [Rhizobium sp. BK312]|uniref:IMPACT family protein n=1 Tax=Rhizobium sp. BK312 TaxID=2587080 RepID=UPI000DDC2591|nr:YigZ family protein [Rhizobium sp. BK312]MBB3425690.1 putative YigZ family protein [Rhizobium sp. BK312]